MRKHAAHVCAKAIRKAAKNRRQRPALTWQLCKTRIRHVSPGTSVPKSTQLDVFCVGKREVLEREEEGGEK